MMLALLLAMIAAYLIGAIPSGVVLTRLAGSEDIRKVGSGNIGATNVYRVAGRKLGLLTLIGDVLKGVLPVLAAQWLHFSDGQVGLIAAAAFTGHCFPVYLGFKGGKGVATALGIFLVISPLAALGAAAVFGLLVWKWRYISLGSICAAAAMPVLVFFINRSLPLVAATLFISAVVIFRHQQNISRLLAGSENRFKA
ncbi:glycerol-3-phosphate 1-O-acyltransferase PlsY [Desulfuromonas sp. CSMB_57]|jgi:acyl phosphate:glycerol-3-phosphate acyltransferase|uniref:glycerol-3-phosphate 1-O-acyltransferase PlsY n=1 Tax=Desulfuromonas sp. CSMB_57 TaxID=2807629 RepID=UPI0020BFF95E|nr:glycerol-3-phosphate 1-O-acyltransferase PlsY [Desulfuromonas sp. CSMB_57]